MNTNALLVPEKDVPPVDPTETGYVPDGYESVEDFLKYVREEYSADLEFDRENRENALIDSKFASGDQWDAAVERARLATNRPCMTINVLPQFIGQVVGDRRLNRTSIKVSPLRTGTQQVAEVRSGIIKSIEASSRAERAYDAACEDQVTCGISNLRVDMDYATNDVFEQDLFIRHIPNPLAVVWDRLSIDPTGRDARHCFVTDSLPRNVYDRRYPNHPAPAALGEADLTETAWISNDVVRITEFWELIEKPVTLAMMADGDVKDITGADINTLQEQVATDPRTGLPVIRKTVRTYARMHLVTGFALLSEEPYELPLTRLPIIRVEGRVMRVGEQRKRFGLVRFARDSQRLKNYWRSVAAETMGLAPKATWIAPEDAIEGYEDLWKNANVSTDTLVYNKNASQIPQRVAPPPVPTSLLQEAQMNQQDIKDTTGLHDASLGIRSNEVSGKAIQARQREGDVATITYHDNLNSSIQECGDVLNQLIPLAYDTMRTVRIIGIDDREKIMTINDPNDDESPDVTGGKYDVSLHTGPSFTTQRQEALDAMLTLMQTSPNLMGIIGDLVAENMDWPGAHQIAERLRKTIPQELLGDEDKPEPTPEQRAQMQAQAAQAEQAQAMQQAQLEDAVAQLEHAAKMREIELAEAQEKLDLAEAKTLEQRSQTVKAAAMAKIAQIEAETAGPMARQKMHLAERAASAKEASSETRGAGSRPTDDRSNKATQGKDQ